jgi:hypothetical protein
MKFTLEVPDPKAAFIEELLASIPFVRAKRVPSRRKSANDTDAATFLQQDAATHTRLLAAIDRLERQ